MAESSEKQTVVQRAEGLSDQMLESVDTGRQAVSEAMRKFTNTLEEETPALADSAQRKALVDAALDLADELSKAMMELTRGIMHSATEALSGKSGRTKE